MLLSDRPRTQYQKPTAREVICQLRFPAILSISGRGPAEYQETVRDEFPRYACRQDAPPPGPNGPRQPIPNHQFLSEDGLWRLSLTQDFFALSTLAYSDWEEFARRLDQPLAAFIKQYRPAHFLRVGLRYVNVISRARLGLEEDLPWTELLTPAYTAPFREPDADEARLLSWTGDLTIKLDSSCRARVRSGLLRPKNPQQAEKETCFLLDIDLSMGGSLEGFLAAGALETLHGHAGCVFEGALTDRLRDAMEPV